MRLRSVLATAALLIGSLAAVAPATASTTDTSDVQALPLHMQGAPAPNNLVGASADYVMHDVHTLPAPDGHSHLTILRVADGTAAWQDFDASPDAVKVMLEGDYYVEQIGESTYWPTSMRFVDIESHQLAGEIPLPSGQMMVGVGPGWLLSTIDGASTSHLVIHRLDGSTVDLPDVTFGSNPSFATDGIDAWLHDSANGPLYDIDIARGTATTVPQPAGMTWHDVVVGPTTIFNVDQSDASNIKVTTIDRDTGASSTYAFGGGLSGNPRFMPLGGGLAVYQPSTDGVDGTLSKVSLDAATGGAALGEVVSSNLSDARPVGAGKVALVVEAGPPGAIAVADGAEVTHVADLPPAADGARAISYDGHVRATWGDDTTWAIDPQSTDPQWSETAWTPHQGVTTAGAATLVEDLGSNGSPTTQWHLSWPGGERDYQAESMTLGHGGELAVVRPVGSSDYQVVRVDTGEVVATTAAEPVADGSRVWTLSSDGELSGVDVDNPSATPVTVQTGKTSAGLVDVRGRWALLASPGYTVVDTLGVEPSYSFPAAQNNPLPPSLGAGFVVWPKWTYDASRDQVTSLMVTDLGPGNQTRPIVDAYGRTPTTYAVDEAGSPSLAYVDAAGQPSVLHLPWLQQAPLTKDTTAPVPGRATGSPRFTARDVVTYSYGATDDVQVASYDVGVRSAAPGSGLGSWATLRTATTDTRVSRSVVPGSEWCFRFRARDEAGNVSGWSPGRCSSVEIQDSAFRHSGNATRCWSALALDHHYLRLHARGAWLRRTPQVGRTLALWVLAGPRQGRADVLVGGVQVGRLSLGAASRHRRLVTFAMPRSGAVSVVELGVRAVGVDAMAVER